MHYAPMQRGQGVQKLWVHNGICDAEQGQT